MRLVRLTAPTDAVVDLARAKQHLNVDSGHHDAKITDLVAAATTWLDGDRGVLGRCLMPQRWAATLPCFACRAIELPLPPTIAVISIAYLDIAGAQRTLSADDYRHVGGGSDAAHIVLKSGRIWPQTACEPDAVRITFEAGYAPGSPEIEPLRRAILMMVERWYDSEGGDDVPSAVEALISNFRLCPM
jgi:uncharacterized phiE125 gp8 family phage protein